MGDLRAELRPLVDHPARPPLPMSEIAARARRRRLRKRSAGAGLALGAVALVFAVATGDPTTRVATTAPQSSIPATSPRAAPPRATSSSAPTSSTTTTAAAPAPDESLVASPGITATSTTTSSWDSGSCIEIHLTNSTAASIKWEVETAPPGRVTTTWNATPTGATFRGEPWNAELAAGGTTTFGFCVAT